nr:hypothetical protein [Tanacetum cinerariifolium]
MSSPGHSTSNNEDAFSSNIPDYVSTISNYFPASSGKTYSNASNNSTAPAMTQATIRQLISDGIDAALEAQAGTWQIPTIPIETSDQEKLL